MQRSVSVESLTEELTEARQVIEKLRTQQQVCRWISIILWIILMLGIFLLILIRVSYMLEWKIMTGRVIFAELQVERENVTRYELTVWGTNKEKKERNRKEYRTFLEMVRQR